MKDECSEYKHAWSAMQLPAARADLFRYCLLYVNGGVWSDVDIVPMVPLEGKIHFNVGLVVVHDAGTEEGYLYNAFLAAKPKHPVLRRAMDIVLAHYHQQLEAGAVWVTGPNVLWRAVKDTMGAVREHSFVGDDRVGNGVQYLLFDGNVLKDHSTAIMKAKYDGYLEDAQTHGGGPHSGRSVTWRSGP